jgi:hypothetical protein
MNVNSITSLLPSYLLTPNSTATSTGNANSASSVQQPADVLGLSPAAQFLNQLQQLQTQDPQKFQQVISQITAQLQQAATTASNNGNTAQATQLTQLAKSFQNVAGGGQLPTAQQLQQAGLSGHHHHHGGGHHESAPSSAVSAFQTQATTTDSQNQDLLSSIFGSLTSS